MFTYKKQLNMRILHTTVQIGLRNKKVENHVNQWIINIEDMTSRAHYIHELVKMNKLDMAYAFLPKERIYLV
ncbi:DUF4291 family protein [Xenorhabdus poinarii]|nr:DUF4291 family protein [Xenorhabdus poinarii]